MSGLLKKKVQVDEALGTVIGVPEGTAVSYAEIQKGLHKYIRDHGLKTDTPKETAPAVQSSEPEVAERESQGLFCISCGESIPAGPSTATYAELQQ